ncbi:antibiotic biosynthesis monooxygenase family protein [Sulfobacillus harzensis]|uniref:Antibiotic biosynthesis monooxygenase n=1 Tax=Sulfobacillus harzensis TaxID=2729629 RepID=A0A7Y0L0U8_9FIRM|nr:antibiotic biosynthesis monooxygenase [Sulfobacillus harzensis]NMP21218.1 antibiotic biosynthesis monooxygenase [Sulfobacillus harzensis]
MYVVMNVLSIPEDAKGHMAQMFAGSGENMKKIPGCLEFQFLDAVGENKQVVYTKWESEADFEAWRNSDAFAQAHSHDRTSRSPATGSKIEKYTVVYQS